MTGNTHCWCEHCTVTSPVMWLTASRCREHVISGVCVNTVNFTASRCREHISRLCLCCEFHHMAQFNDYSLLYDYCYKVLFNFLHVDCFPLSGARPWLSVVLLLECVHSFIKIKSILIFSCLKCQEIVWFMYIKNMFVYYFYCLNV